MAKSSKFASAGRGGDTLGAVPKQTTQQYMPDARGGKFSSTTRDTARLGSDDGTMNISSHNDISAFQRGVKSRGPYGGPTFSSLNTLQQNYQRSTPSSNYRTPSGGGVASARGKTVDSSTGSGGNYNNVMTENKMSRNATRHPDETNRRQLRGGRGTGSGKLGQ